MALDPTSFSPDTLEFLEERHLATLTILRPDGTPHVTPVGFTWDNSAGLARIITWDGAIKARLLEAANGGPAAITQLDGGRWLTLEGRAVVTADPIRAADGERRYAERYSQPQDRGPQRRVIEVTVTRAMGRV
jgi:F420H(2)-dependent biliverdin reductase